MSDSELAPPPGSESLALFRRYAVAIARLDDACTILELANSDARLGLDAITVRTVRALRREQTRLVMRSDALHARLCTPNNSVRVDE